ncbi:MAG: signal transduction histidine kinase [Cognaticolwellia sp.]|jgi:two-component system NtrC family sensor kinase
MNDNVNPYEQAYEREKKARLRAEYLLEEKTRQLFHKEVTLRENFVTLRQQEAAMLKSEKLATLGTLSAGIAHEVNNPLAFVLSNMESLMDYTNSFRKLLLLTQTLLDQNELSEPVQTVFNKLIEQEDLTFTYDDVIELLNDTGDGLHRVRDIIDNLRSFSRSQSADRIKTDLLEGLNSTLKLIKSELNESVDLKLSLQPLPSTLCNTNELNQVFLNLIINAIYATKDIDKATIKISSHYQDDTIFIRIQDNGCGMSEKVKKQIFVPFFTTKPVGQGTGLGMAVVYGIITDHHGDILVKTKEGAGTTFEIQLPVVNS